jgi:hypothetical protein
MVNDVAPSGLLRIQAVRNLIPNAIPVVVGLEQGQLRTKSKLFQQSS